MISEPQRDEFVEKGLIRLPGFIPGRLTRPLQEAIASELSRLGLRVGGKYHSSKLQAMPVFQQTTYLSGQVNVGRELEKLFTPELFKLMSELAQSRLEAAHPFPQLLMSLPHKEEWSLQNLNWHLDYKNSRMDILPGIQVFILIDEVRPHGGATLALTGSHRLHRILPGQNAHHMVRQNREFTNHPEKFLEPREIEGVPVQIVEMSGDAGDVFLMDLRVLHTPSLNAQTRARVMMEATVSRGTFSPGLPVPWSSDYSRP